jgi:tRNA U34 5-carboxymethylaminomethyl modifying GTPase MnmE/TrmE
MEIRQALQPLEEITREITTDEIPSRMYSTFCLGK